ncbi:MAG TPA: diguanylate cyclase, partial [Candidatus Nanopelagicales bacterium]|nr:diguanylate cyclase [Candidatus Nanopelagicales bacterium]
MTSETVPSSPAQPEIEMVRGDVPRSIFESLASGVVVQAADGRIVEANAAACRILGMTWDQMQGRTSVDPRWRAVHEDGSELPGDQHPAMVCIASGEPVRDVVMGVHKPDGGLTWILVNAEPIRDADGRPTGSVATTFTDLTEQVRLRAELVESENRYRLLAENSADIVLLLEDDVVTWVSPSITPVLGWAPEQWIGHDRSEFVHPEDVPVMLSDAAALTPGLPERTRRRVRARNGVYHWVDAAIRLDVRDDGSVGKVLALRVVDAEIVARDVEHRAAHDTLTGLLNRAEILDRLARALGEAAARGHATGVLFCDVDDFKDVNDSHGHVAGDAVLRAVAERLRGRLRGGDLVGRIGGDEMLVVLENIGDLDRAAQVAGSLLEGAAQPVS